MQDHPLIHSLKDAALWFARRDQSMAAARKNVATLTNPSSFWGLTRKHPTVLAANKHWVGQAKTFHRIAMGFQPVCMVNGQPLFVGA